ncbi:MAG: transposase [Thermodesulfobacteriota bacterium]
MRGFDYSSSGFYFVTICTHKRQCILGYEDSGRVVLSKPGTIVRCHWENLSQRFAGVRSDSFVVMPNHVHGIIVLTGDTEPVSKGAAREAYGNDAGTASIIEQRCRGAIHCARIQDRTNAPVTLGQVVRALKAASGRTIRAEGIAGRVWQRNYYEHVIRTERALEAIRQYIEYNPLLWALDHENPQSVLATEEYIKRRLPRSVVQNEEKLNRLANLFSTLGNV